MNKVSLYIRGQGKSAQRARLQALFPSGEEVIDSKPPQMLEQLIAEAGPGDVIAADTITAIPEITAETFKTVCGKGAALCFAQQPYLQSEIFRVFLADDLTQAAAAAILQKQIDAAGTIRAQLREKEKAGLNAAAAAGRKGGRRPGEKQITRKEIRAKAAIRALMAQGLTGPELMERVNADAGDLRITRNTFYKYVRELKAEDAQEAEANT